MDVIYLTVQDFIYWQKELVIMEFRRNGCQAEENKFAEGMKTLGV